jgi:hypothetical protein
VYLVHGQVDVSKYFTGWATLVDEYVEQRGKFGRFVNSLAQSNDGPFPCVVRNGAQSGRPAGLLGIAQLNLPLNPAPFEALSLVVRTE